MVAIAIWWLPSLFPGDQVAPKPDPPSTTGGIYPPSHHTRIAITINIHTMQKGGKIPLIAVGGGAVRQSVGRPIAVSRPDPSWTTEHRYTTSHHTKIISLPPSIVCFGGGKFQASLRQSVSRSGCTDRIHTTPGSPPSLSMMIKGTMAGHSGLPRVNGLCARLQIPRWQNTITTAAAACAGGRF